MKVKLLKNVSIAGVVHRRGKVVNLHSAGAMNLVINGEAEKVKPPKASVGPDKNKKTAPSDNKKSSKKKSKKSSKK